MMDSSVIVLLAAIALGFGLALGHALLTRRFQIAIAAALARVGSSLRGHFERAERQQVRQESSLREIEQRLRGGQGEHLRQMEKRLGELQTTGAKSGGQLQQTLIERFEALQREVAKQLADSRGAAVRSQGESRDQLQAGLNAHRNAMETRQVEALTQLQKSLDAGSKSNREQLQAALNQNSVELGKRMDELTRRTDERLREISGQVEKRLAEGFEKTTATFADVVKRLALIDEAQKKITELSTNVVGLQEVLSDKRARGAFGEVQLNALVRNVMPESSFSIQHRLSNDRIVDCLLFLPPPTGNVAIDAKFPLEAFKQMTSTKAGQAERKTAERQFKQDIKAHIQAISSKYILPGETADGAVMFIPAEAVFAEIQGNHPDLVEIAQRARVWMTSPTTLMAILNTARAVLKDEATRQQVHIIQEHLGHLGKDFERFQDRMDKLAKHVNQAQKDVEQVNISAQKISTRFNQIEAVEMDSTPALSSEADPE